MQEVLRLHSLCRLLVRSGYTLYIVYEDNIFLFCYGYIDPPDILTGPQDYRFNEASLTCTVTGIPAVTIYWQFAGVNITADTSATITYSLGFSIVTTGFLTICSAQRSNAGVYTCVGSNGIGPDVSVKHNITVNCE